MAKKKRLLKMKVFLTCDTTSESICKSKRLKRKEREEKKNLKREMAEEWAELDTKAPPATEGREREMRGRQGGRDADGGGGDSRSSGRRGRGGATQATIAEARLLSPTTQQALNSLAPTTGHRLSPVTMTPCLPT